MKPEKQFAARSSAHRIVRVRRFAWLHARKWTQDNPLLTGSYLVRTDEWAAPVRCYVYCGTGSYRGQTSVVWPNGRREKPPLNIWWWKHANV
jgi:hypothetical protein